jgi:hypothetical protein
LSARGRKRKRESFFYNGEKDISQTLCGVPFGDSCTNVFQQFGVVAQNNLPQRSATSRKERKKKN